MKEAELYSVIFKKWGVNKQLEMLQEECAELIVAVSKMKRNKPDAATNFIEELADVQNMVNQFSRLYPSFEAVRKKKLAQVAKLLEEL